VLRQQVEAAVKKYVKWDLEAVTGQVEYIDGNGYRDLVLRQPFITGVTDVWVDSTGAYGDGPTPFAASTKLSKGNDYALVREGGQGKSGLLRRLTYSTIGFFPSDLFLFRSGGLGYSKPAYWPVGYGNIKVQYDYGFNPIPDDIKLAVETAVGTIRNTIKYGWPMSSENLSDYSYSLAIARDPVFGDVRQLLSNYRDTSI